MTSVVKTSFWEELKRSTILQAILTILIWTAMIVLWLQGRDVPLPLLAAGTTVLGYYFGVKVEQLARMRYEREISQRLAAEEEARRLCEEEAMRPMGVING